MRQRTVKRRTLWSVQALPPFRKDVLPDKEPQRDRLACVLGLRACGNRESHVDLQGRHGILDHPGSC
jgi:hypothetical protein